MIQQQTGLDVGYQCERIRCDKFFWIDKFLPIPIEDVSLVADTGVSTAQVKGLAQQVVLVDFLNKIKL
jgi:hypothetical protein